jgi:aminomuconate-semialdehyde/2-hydroxymuconate-6-semialdehyde dehydrogenase
MRLFIIGFFSIKTVFLSIATICENDKDDTMLQTTIRSSFTNQGQICLCGSRILVQRSLYDKFLSDFTNRVSQLKVGNPFEEDTNIGAIVSKPHFGKILSYITLAKEEGGTIHFGGNTLTLEGDLSEGYYIQPTIITGLNAFCRVNTEEIFGPVVTIIPFDTEEEALQYANATEYGLSCTIWTSNLSKAHRFANEVEAGIVWVNCWLMRDLRTPFGGMKNSGVGREGGFHALEFFTETKNICIKL